MYIIYVYMLYIITYMHTICVYILLFILTYKYMYIYT